MADAVLLIMSSLVQKCFQTALTVSHAYRWDVKPARAPSAPHSLPSAKSVGIRTDRRSKMPGNLKVSAVAMVISK